jgi:phospholipid/cholesterol/gamma-HCH transport system substrate-binding protein
MRVEKSTNQFLAQPGGRPSIRATPVLEALEYRFAGFARTMNGNPGFSNRRIPVGLEMKRRATNLVVGSATLAVVAAALGIVFGVQKLHSIQQRGSLRIVFEGSASGLHKGGAVNFDGIQVGEVISLKLENPRRIVALARVENSAPIRKDTIVGLEFQGLTGIAAISLTGGADAAPPPPLDADGVPTLVADLTEIVTIRDTLHSVDRLIISNQTTIKEGLQSFETYTAALAEKSEGITSVVRKADAAIGSFDSAMAKVDGAIAKVEGVMPSLASGDGAELYRSVKSLRELVESFNKRSAVFMNEGRRSLMDISQAVTKVDRKLDSRTGR